MTPSESEMLDQIILGDRLFPMSSEGRHGNAVLIIV